ncbi:Fc.00g022860.m01.CDS01 [Cosmosporella sp. VM-42]
MVRSSFNNSTAPAFADQLRFSLAGLQKGLNHIRSRLTLTIGTLRELVSTESKIRGVSDISVPHSASATPQTVVALRRRFVSAPVSTTVIQQATPNSFPSTTSTTRATTPNPSQTTATPQDDLLSRAEYEVDHLERCVEKYEDFVSEVTDLINEISNASDSDQEKKAVRFTADIKDPGVATKVSFTAEAPTAYAAKMERVHLVEKLQLQMREICWSKIFLDHVPWTVDPKHFPVAKAKAFHSMVKSDLDVTAVEHGQTNAPLRWAIMEMMFQLVRRHILEKPFIHQEPLAITTEANRIDEFFYPFQDPSFHTQGFRDDIACMVRTAIRLRRLLTSDPVATYKFHTPQPPIGGRFLHLLDEAARVMAISGASHADESRDLVDNVVFGALIRITDAPCEEHRYAKETHICVTVRRPRPEENLPEEQEL